MQIDIFKEILVPVIGGLGIFMLGLEFMSDGINHLAANRMRAMLHWPDSRVTTPVSSFEERRRKIIAGSGLSP